MVVLVFVALIAPRINFAVFNDRGVFLMAHPQSDPHPLSGPLEVTKSIHIKNQVVVSHMAAYFYHIFEVATGCSDRLF